MSPEDNNSKAFPGVIDIRTEDFPDFMADYPFASTVDSVDELPIADFTVRDEGSTFRARVLGFGSSYRSSHINHDPGEPLPKGQRCSGCRWTDTAILWSVDHQSYVYVTLGKTMLSGEDQKSTVVWTKEPEDVFRKLFVRTKKNFVRATGTHAIPPQNADAFREAASVDDRLNELLQRYETLVPEASDQRPEHDPLANL